MGKRWWLCQSPVNLEDKIEHVGIPVYLLIVRVRYGHGIIPLAELDHRPINMKSIYRRQNICKGLWVFNKQLTRTLKPKSTPEWVYNMPTRHVENKVNQLQTLSSHTNIFHAKYFTKTSRLPHYTRPLIYPRPLIYRQSWLRRRLPPSWKSTA